MQKGKASPNVIDACRSTITRTGQLRAARSAYVVGAAHSHRRPQAAQAPIAQGIIPSYIHETISERSEGESRETSLRTMGHDAKFRSVREKKKLSRKIYDAQNTEDETNIPRDKILIQEGGPLVSLEADPSADANECYIGFEKTYNFYSKFFNRNSLDDKGLELDGFVHFGKGYQNAFWDPDNERMVFGDGDGEIFNGFTDELDVIGHELSHGVVEFTSPLPYEFQSGALNESLADTFGIMVKQFGEDLENPQTAADSNWLIGEGIWSSKINGRALRDMKNPGTAYDDEKVGKDEQPAHWKDFKKLSRSQDQGGVHINSGIPNHAFYLAATKIGGYAWEGAGQIWYKALTSGGLSTDGTATFKQFADLTIENAGDNVAEVQAAWDEVGYPFPDTVQKS